VTVPDILARSGCASTADQTPHTVPCGFECGYLADSETDLTDHEDECDHRFAPQPPPRPRPVRSLSINRTEVGR